MNRVVHFEIQADDPERAIRFYTDVFGWEIIKWEGGDKDYWLIMTAPKDSEEMGINGGLLKRVMPIQAKDDRPKAYVCTIQVENFDETAKRIEEAGGKMVVPKTALAGMAWQGYYLDTEKNVFGIHQADQNAK